ncbi:hypothetical protein OAS30_01160 [Candidatus Pelagibacter sp.]|nr:hypothetical protein [Candidatus Pelagibacter sp.]
MMTVNPYTILAESVPSAVIQGFVLVMLALIFFWNCYSNDTP